MPRLIIVSPQPLLAEGVAAALRGTPGWEVQLDRADDPADAWVLPGDEILVRGAHGAGAQLAADAPATRLRAAVQAVLEGLSVREAPWFTPAERAALRRSGATPAALPRPPRSWPGSP